MLREPSAPVNDMSTAQCVERLKTLGSSNTEVEALAVLPPAGGVGVLAAEDAIDGYDGGAMVVEDGGGATAIEDEVPIDRPASRSPSVDGDDGEDVFTWPEDVCGVKLHHEDRMTPRGDWSEGLRVTCPIHGAICRKFRSKHLRTMQDGRLAAVFLFRSLVGRLRGSHSRPAPHMESICGRYTRVHVERRLSLNLRLSAVRSDCGSDLAKLSMLIATSGSL